MVAYKWPEGRCHCRGQELRLPDHSPDDAHNRGRMHHDSVDAAPEAGRLVKDAELAEHGDAVIVDLLTCEPIVCVERIDAAERKLDGAAGRRQSAPGTELVSANDDVQNDGRFTDVTPLHVDPQVAHCAQPIRIERANSVSADIVRIPRRVVVTCRGTESRHDAV